MQVKDSARIAYSVEPQALTVNVLKSGAMSILQELAKLKFISLSKPIKKNVRKKTASFGMWKDREDIGNASEYVRDLRKGRRF
ncbi:MAG: hypothetical protein LBU89_00395 [Fibromonadaceae bacterium]|jgi:hypothetical protein|nr:hypothetical protein [Fibromonadaceae bacterium]